MRIRKNVIVLVCALWATAVLLAACNIALPGAPAADNPPAEEPVVDAQATQDAIIASAVEGTSTRLAIARLTVEALTPEPFNTFICHAIQM